MANPAVRVILTGNCNEEQAKQQLTAQTFSNYAINGSQSEFIAFLNPRDLWSPRKLEKQVALLKVNPDLQWCYCASQRNTPRYSGQILRRLILNNFIPSSSVLMRRRAFEMQVSNPEHTDEWDMWLRLSAAYPVEFLAEPLVTEGLAMEDTETLHNRKARVVEAAVARHPVQLKDLRSEALAEICVSAGNSYLAANNRFEARHKFAEALTHNPLLSAAYLCWASSFLSCEAQQQIRDLHALSRFADAWPKAAGQQSLRR